MRFGVIFPQTEIGADPIAVRDYAQAAEELGYDHLAAYDHVLGANPARRPGWSPPYSHKDMFHEPFVLFGYLAGLTKSIQLTTGILILPQRQTVLVAKQAAAVDVLSGGRLRLGIGIGWNDVEYEALGENFKNRGRRSEEQMEVLRRLWTQELVTFQGRWHKITDAGLNPLPIQRPIPIWLGGSAEAVLRRIARRGDGWFPLLQPDEKCRSMIERLRSYTREAGRDPGAVGIEGRILFANSSPEDWVKGVARWKELGATHISVNTMKAGLASPSAHIDAIRRFKAAVART
ncbi:MAG: LLM class F420-dependent oxidoreductase [Deltaproteobacteria bacterium RIFCSPLOWO2_12_FULL_57_22]|nr:MAG: LLM class F420-dependent oxidoreductase [Deltaproteobacteria bacterium RIFCSPLOWO2_12_FULL_57_22]